MFRKILDKEYALEQVAHANRLSLNQAGAGQSQISRTSPESGLHRSRDSGQSCPYDWRECSSVGGDTFPLPLSITPVPTNTVNAACPTDCGSTYGSPQRLRFAAVGFRPLPCPSPGFWPIRQSRRSSGPAGGLEQPCSLLLPSVPELSVHTDASLPLLQRPAAAACRPAPGKTIRPAR